MRRLLVAQADASSPDYSVELRFSAAEEDTSLGGRPGFHGVGANESTTAVGALSRSGTPGPVRVRVDVDGVDILPGVAAHETREPYEVSAPPLESLPGVLRGSGHESADFLGSKLHVHSVRRKVVRTRRRPAVCRVILRIQRAIVLQLGEGCSDSWRRAGIGLPEPTLCDQLLGLAWVRLVLGPLSVHLMTRFRMIPSLASSSPGPSLG